LYLRGDDRPAPAGYQRSSRCLAEVMT
jgi:hypothetical protein